MSEKIKFDLRVGYIEQRYIRDGNAMVCEGRTNYTHPDGTIEFGEWEKISTITNYGDCFDKRNHGRSVSLLTPAAAFFLFCVFVAAIM